MCTLQRANVLWVPEVQCGRRNKPEPWSAAAFGVVLGLGLLS